MIFITSFQRPELLLRLLKELEGEEIVVIDDESDYDWSEHLEYVIDYYRHQHCGKRWFYKLWNFMLSIAKKSGADEFIFLQDDLCDIDLQGLRSQKTPEKFVLNIMNIGPNRNWTPIGQYCDCNFMTNRASLDAIHWQIPAVSPRRWDINANLSSGVGHMLSKKFYIRNVPMLMPDKNYASHGNHERDRKSVV